MMSGTKLEQADSRPIHWTQREIHPNERMAMEAQAYPFIFPPLSRQAQSIKQEAELTDDEIWKEFETHGSDMIKAARAIIAAHKEKNK